MRKFVPVSLAAAVLAGSVALAAPAQAQPIVTGGLVNVTVTNVLNDNTVTVQVPVTVGAQVAAAVCGVNVGGILGVLATPGATYTCDSRNGNQTVTVGPLA